VEGCCDDREKGVPGRERESKIRGAACSVYTRDDAS
jgi:hypothetical protein